MTYYRHDPAFLKIVDAMIETVEFDVNGRAGQGGNGGLTSDKAIRLSGEARIMRDRIRTQEAGLFPIEIAPELKAQPVFFVAYDDDKYRQNTWNVESEDFEAANSHCKLFQEKYVGKPFPNGQGNYPYQNVRVLVSDKIVTLNADALDLPEMAPHPDDTAISNFAMAMSAKMTISRVQNGRGGWEDKQQCTQQELSLALVSAQVRDVATAREFADRMFKMSGFMLSEDYRGKPAVTITFPDNAERNQFYSAIVDLSKHKTPAAPAAEVEEKP